MTVDKYDVLYFTFTMLVDVKDEYGVDIDGSGGGDDDGNGGSGSAAKYISPQNTSKVMPSANSLTPL